MGKQTKLKRAASGLSVQICIRVHFVSFKMCCGWYSSRMSKTVDLGSHACKWDLQHTNECAWISVLASLTLIFTTNTTFVVATWTQNGCFVSFSAQDGTAAEGKANKQTQQHNRYVAARSLFIAGNLYLWNLMEAAVCCSFTPILYQLFWMEL